jgi:N-acetylmuramoyl-L-alanine amidase
MAVRITAEHFIEGAARLDLGQAKRPIAPTRIVLHYSGGSTLASAVATLRARKLSYHVLIDVDGSYHQARTFDRPSSHAGRSNWKAQGGLTNASSLNPTSIGISMINLGRFDYLVDGRWYYGFAGGRGLPPSIDDAAANKHALLYQPARPVHWSPYDPRQLDACQALVEAIVARYPTITELVGHHDIAIDDKPDPGPLWPLEPWRVALGLQGGLGLEARVNAPDGSVNLRDRPGIEGRILRRLVNGAAVHIRSVPYTGPRRGLVDGGNGRALSGWASVDIDRSNTHAGFIYMKYLTKTPLAPAYAARL